MNKFLAIGGILFFSLLLFGCTDKFVPNDPVDLRSCQVIEDCIMVEPKGCCNCQEAINIKYQDYWNNRSTEKCPGVLCKVCQLYDEPEATCLKGTCLVHSSQPQEALRQLVSSDWNITEKTDTYPLPIGAESGENCRMFEMVNPNEQYIQEHGGYFNYAAFHDFWFCPKDWNGTFKESGPTEQTYNAKFLCDCSKYKVYHYSMGNNSESALPQKLILRTGSPEDKEKFLDKIIKDLIECNAQKYDFDPTMINHPCLDPLIPLVPEIIELVQDTTPLERHGDTGWGFVHNQATIALGWYAHIVDGIDRREDPKYGFFESSGMPSESDIYNVHYNWLEWWEKNDPQSCVKQQYAQQILDFDRFVYASTLPVSEDKNSLCHDWFEKGDQNQPKWAIGKIMRIIDSEGYTIDNNHSLINFVLMGNSRTATITLPIKNNELENYRVYDYLKVDMLNICRSIEMLVSSQSEPPVAKQFTPPEKVSCN